MGKEKSKMDTQSVRTRSMAKKLNSVNSDQNKINRKRGKSPIDSNESVMSEASKRKLKKSSHVEKVVASIEEDDQIFEMHAEGQLTDFASETEGEDEGKSGKTQSISTQTDTDEETEISLNSRIIMPNVVVHDKIDCSADSDVDDELEEGECSQHVVDVMEEEKQNSSAAEANLIDERINTLMAAFQNYFKKKLEDVSRVAELERQLAENKRHLEELKSKGTRVMGESGNDESLMNKDKDNDQHSEIMEYHNAFERKRGSTSSEDDLIDTSDEFTGALIVEKQLQMAISDKDRLEAGTSGQSAPDGHREKGHGRQNPKAPPEGKTPAEQRVVKVVQDADCSRARVYEVKGNEIEQRLKQIRIQQERLVNQAIPINRSVGESYLLVASHVDEVTREKILNNQYIDFAKLLKHDQPGVCDDDQKMIMVNRGGLSYWVPMADKNNTINGYVRWDQAFRVFLDIYTGKFPGRMSELIQYGHIIFTASYTYSWDNVYLYDREFRKHIERFPDRSWGIILQQAWSMFLKDRVNVTPTHYNKQNGRNTTDHKPGLSWHLCFAFNNGYCKFGSKCKFDHRCGLCGKFGYGTHNCRKAQSVISNHGNSGEGKDKQVEIKEK